MAKRGRKKRDAVRMAMGAGDCNRPLGRKSKGGNRAVAMEAEQHAVYRSRTSAFRGFYKKVMDGQLKDKVAKVIDGERMTIGFTKYGNKHLYSDTYERGRRIQKSDLFHLAKIVEKSEYVKDGSLSKERKDNIVKFYYFKTRLHGDLAYLNVAEAINPRSGKRYRYLYSVTDKIKKSE